MTKQLRIYAVLVQPVLVWDDGDTLTPADPVQPSTVPLSSAAAAIAALPAEVAALERRLAAADADTA